MSSDRRPPAAAHTTSPAGDAWLRRGVRELADAVPVPPIGPLDLRAEAARRRAPRRRAGRWLPALAAAGAVLAIVAVGVLPAALPDRGPGTGAAPEVAVLPRTFADHSYLTAHVSDAPPGPAIALYSYNQGDMPYQTPQVLVVGADGRRYREVDAATKPSRVYPDSWSSAATSLSPDGTKVAVGESASIVVVDLVTGDRRRYPVEGPARQMVAWSPDSGRLLYLAFPPVQDRFEEVRDAEPVVLDLGTGSLTTIPGQRGTVDAAFAPDGERLALQRHDELRIVRMDGTVERAVPLPDRHRLAGGDAWSPDGTRLALYQMGDSSGPDTVYGLPGTGDVRGLAVVDLASGDATTLASPPGLSRVLLGWWRDGLLVDTWEAIVRVPLSGGPVERLSAYQHGNDHFVVEVDLATALLDGAEVRDAGVDRGPWPLSVRLLVTAGVLIAGLLVVRRVTGPRRRRPSKGWRNAPIDWAGDDL